MTSGRGAIRRYGAAVVEALACRRLRLLRLGRLVAPAVLQFRVGRKQADLVARGPARGFADGDERAAHAHEVLESRDIGVAEHSLVVAVRHHDDVVLAEVGAAHRGYAHRGHGLIESALEDVARPAGGEGGRRRVPHEKHARRLHGQRLIAAEGNAALVDEAGVRGDHLDPPLGGEGLKRRAQGGGVLGHPDDRGSDAVLASAQRERAVGASNENAESRGLRHRGRSRGSPGNDVRHGRGFHLEGLELPGIEPRALAGELHFREHAVHVEQRGQAPGGDVVELIGEQPGAALFLLLQELRIHRHVAVEEVPDEAFRRLAQRNDVRARRDSRRSS